MIMALSISILVAGGVYLILTRGMVRIILGIGLISHAGNLLLLATGIGAWRGEPFMNRTSMDAIADPLPQAFVLTAIVISMAVTTILLTLSALGSNDDTHVAERMPEDGPSTIDTAGRRIEKQAARKAAVEKAEREAAAKALSEAQEVQR
ncbi:cation:proton antiporter subunit C [Corynebacterium uropygiale]|uniref:Cation:proton antiporter subunit C n=1 Tax=Corynebacterium uropygiale TaxID=1775911 RepID=A0A9X1TZU2_9CORY|nr:cation:proton antiporter subunit C [Corynebacterium uropygiale]MCF4005733.1 cation:proton antiporter subunit C [Corynebacterium uropygiale]